MKTHFSTPKTMTNNIIPLDQIPPEVIAEIKQYYPIVDFSNYGKPVSEKCVSRLMKYRHEHPEPMDIKILGENSEYVEVKNAKVAGTFAIRGSFEDDTAEIYYVCLAGLVRV